MSEDKRPPTGTGIALAGFWLALSIIIAANIIAEKL